MVWEKPLEKSEKIRNNFLIIILLCATFALKMQVFNDWGCHNPQTLNVYNPIGVAQGSYLDPLLFSI